MSVVSKWIQHLNYNDFKKEMDYFINRLVGQNRFVAVQVYEQEWPHPGNKQRILKGIVWFREAKRDLGEDDAWMDKVTFIPDDVLEHQPELAEINSSSAAETDR